MQIGRWILWGVVITAILMMLFGIGVIVYSVTSRTMSNNYTARVKLSLNAAALSDEGVLIEDGETLMRLEDECRRKLAFYLTQNPTLPLLVREDQAKALSFRIGQDTLVLVPVKGDGERAVVHFRTGEKSYRMVIRQSNLWENIVLCVGEENRTPLESGG